MTVSTNRKDRLLAVVVVAGILAMTIFFAFFVIRNFSAPLAGIGDTENSEYMGYYMARHLSFSFFPQLNLVNNDVFFPYGTNSVFQAWGIERDLFYAFLYSMFGVGPWLQWYYLLSIVITVCGATLMLRGEFGLLQAVLAAVLVTFFNFYAIHKYPGHYNLIILHWTILSMLCDFVIYRRYILRGTVALSWFLLRMLLLVLCLGHDLGYVAGYSLSSFSMVSLFIIGREMIVSRRLDMWNIVTFDKRDRTVYLFLGMMLIAFAYLYVPIASQIFLNAREFKDVHQGRKGCSRT